MQWDFRLLSAIRLHKFRVHRDKYIAGKQTANGQQCTAHNGHILTRRSMPEMDPRSKLQKGILRRPTNRMGAKKPHVPGIYLKTKSDAHSHLNTFTVIIFGGRRSCRGGEREREEKKLGFCSLSAI